MRTIKWQKENTEVQNVRKELSEFVGKKESGKRVHTIVKNVNYLTQTMKILTKHDVKVHKNLLLEIDDELLP
jgi:hypothetical protein